MRAGEIFHQSLDIDKTLHNVARLAVESFADLCLFDLIDERSDRLYVTAAAHRDPHLERLIKKAEQLIYNAEFRLHPVLQVTQSGDVFFLPKLDPDVIRRHAASREHAQYMFELGYQSKIVVPVSASGEIFGALTFVLTRQGQHFDSNDVELAAELGRRAGLAVANAKQFGREQHVAATLQRAFLNAALPETEGLRFFALYRPGLDESQLGGDWYDAYRLPSGRYVITIGDVAGKGVEAARTMVQMRQSVRIASLVSEEPSAILGLVNNVLLLEAGEKLATCFVAVADAAAKRLAYASAGHVPPFFRMPDGAVTPLASPDPPLGIARETPFAAHAIETVDGSMLVAYTDGVTEIQKDVIAGEATLRDVLRHDAISVAADPARYAERATFGVQRRDDVAIIVASFGRSPIVWRFDAGDPRAANAIKDEFSAAVSGLASADSDLDGCRLIYGEIIGNCVRHAGSALSLSLSVESGSLMLNAIDEGPGFDYDPKLPFDIWAESGRGLFLVSQLAKSVRVSRLPRCGSCICAELPVTLERRPLPAETRRLVTGSAPSPFRRASAPS